MIKNVNLYKKIIFIILSFFLMPGIYGCSIPFESDTSEKSEVIGNFSPPGKMDKEFESGSIVSNNWFSKSLKAIALLKPINAKQTNSTLTKCTATAISFDLVVTSSKCASLCSNGAIGFYRSAKPTPSPTAEYKCAGVEKLSTALNKSFAILRFAIPPERSTDLSDSDSLDLSKSAPVKDHIARMFAFLESEKSAEIFVSKICEIKNSNLTGNKNAAKQPNSTTCSLGGARKINWLSAQNVTLGELLDNGAPAMGSPILDNSSGEILGIIESVDQGNITVTLASDILNQ